MWKTFLIFESYQTNQSEMMMGHHLHELDTIFDLWSVCMCVCLVRGVGEQN